MRVSSLFQLYTPTLIAQRTATYLSDFGNLARYEDLAQEIASAPEENITFVLTRGENGLRLAGVDNFEDIFKMMEPGEIGNLDTGDIKEKIRDAVEILEGYSFFRI